MIREALAAKGVGRREGFRWRGEGEITRLEGFSDAVFAFAITLLVVSLEVPKTYGELKELTHGLLAFAIGFFTLFQIWYFQYRFFRRYALQDMTTIVLNGFLLFVVLFYVYPLKFLFTWLVTMFTGGSTVVTLPGGVREEMVQAGEGAQLMLLYGLGFVAVFGIFLLMDVHALRKKDELGLNALEVFDTRAGIRAHAIGVAVGTLSLLFAALGGARWAGVSGLTYMLLGPLHTVNGMLVGRRRRRLL